MKTKLSFQTKKRIRQALREDIGKGDITTQALIPSHLRGRAYIKAKSNGILAGSEVVSEVFRAVDPGLRVKKHVSDGGRIRKGQKVFSLEGRAASILKGERVALNFLSRLSGVATLTRRFSEKVKGTKAKIYDTRKTTPLWRELEKSAVKAGGGFNHRFGLWDQALIKDNHWAALQNPVILSRRRRRRISGDRFFAEFTLEDVTPLRMTSEGLRMTLMRLRRQRKFIEIEVENVQGLVRVLPLRPDAVLLDNFSISNLRQAVQAAKAFRKKPLLEASGGVHLENARSIAKTGVDRISVGALTHSAPALDFSLTLN